VGNLRGATGCSICNVSRDLGCTTDPGRCQRRRLRKLIRPRIRDLREIVGALMATPCNDSGGGSRHCYQGE
jgi:hypothetical protein